MSADRYLVDPSCRVRLEKLDPDDTGNFESREDAQQKLQTDIDALEELQEKLFAQARYGVLVVLQGMDTAGKDGIIKHVMCGLNPAGVVVSSFKEPSAEELRHDYLWRAQKAIPERGRIAIFNRSYYEDVIVTRVHPQLLGEFTEQAEKQGDAFWERRFRDIDGFERYLTDNNIVVLKVFLHVSKGEQKKRLLKRLNDDSKHWKFSAADLAERSFWDSYVRAYEHAITHTASSSPWYIVPADHKWFARLTVAGIIVDRLKKLHLEYPKTSPQIEESLAKAKESIESEG